MLSIEAIHQHEIEKIKGSRFIAYAFPVKNIQALQVCLERIQKDV